MFSKYDEGDQMKDNVIMGHTAHMEEKTKACNTVVRKPSSINHI
jgi:hypothetical protein